MKNSLLLAACLLSAFLSLAQEEEDVGPINTDRPVQSETPNIVPRNYLQAEMGLNHIKSGYYYNLDGPNLLLKYGLVKDLELRFSNNYISNNRKIRNKYAEVASGLDMSRLGMKYKIFHQDDDGLDMTISAHTYVDLFADDNFAYKEGNAQFRLTTCKTISGNWYGIVGVEYSYLAIADDQAFYTLQTGTSLAEGLTGIIEYYGYYGSGVLQHAVNAGLVYLLTDNHQIDLSGGAGLGDNYYDYYLQVGYSCRIGL